MKYEVTGVAVLAAIVGPLAYFAHVYSPTYHQWIGAPNFFRHVQRPPPPSISVEAVREEEAVDAAVKSIPPLKLNGKEVVTVQRLDRAPEEWAKIDSQTRSDAQVRKFYNVHNPR